MCDKNGFTRYTLLFMHLFSCLWSSPSHRAPQAHSDLICARSQAANTGWICGNSLTLQTDWTFGSCTGLSKSRTRLWSGRRSAWTGGCSSWCCCPSPLYGTCFGVCSSRRNSLRSRRGGDRWRACRSTGYSSCWDSPAGQRGSLQHSQNLRRNKMALALWLKDLVW